MTNKTTLSRRLSAREKDILKIQLPILFGLASLAVAGCARSPVTIAESSGCEIGPDLLQYCEPPVLPTVYTMEQFDLAFTEAYVCTHQLNAQLAEILRRCSGEEKLQSVAGTFAGSIQKIGSDVSAAR